MRKILIAVAILVISYPLFHTAMFGYAWADFFRDLIVCVLLSGFLFSISRLVKRVEMLERELNDIKDRFLTNTNNE